MRDTIFISYRRSDTRMVAILLHLLLEKELGVRVFLDRSEIEPGDKYPERLKAELARARILLVLIGRDWLGSNADGSLRIQEDDDWVRREVETGVAEQRVTVIPVLVGYDAKLPLRTELPKDLTPMLDRAPYVLSPDYIERDTQYLASKLAQRGFPGSGGSAAAGTDRKPPLPDDSVVSCLAQSRFDAAARMAVAIAIDSGDEGLQRHAVDARTAVQDVAQDREQRLLDFVEKVNRSSTVQGVEHGDRFLAQASDVVDGRFVPGERSDEAIVCENLSKSYPSTGFTLTVSALSVRRGEVLGVVGPNGSGKTTLLGMLAGAVAPSTGEIRYVGLGDFPWCRRGIAFVEQAPRPWSGTFKQQLSQAAAFAGVSPKRNAVEIRDVLALLDLEGLADLSWSQLSGGMKTRCSLAIALISHPQVLILDEPLAPLDPVAQAGFLLDIKNQARSAKRHLPVIVSSHQVHELEWVADRIVVTKDGRVTEYRPPEELQRTIFEVAEGPSPRRLEELLGPDVVVRDRGLYQEVELPQRMRPDEFLGRLSAETPRYFRDVTRSVKRELGEGRR